MAVPLDPPLDPPDEPPEDEPDGVPEDPPEELDDVSGALFCTVQAMMRDERAKNETRVRVMRLGRAPRMPRRFALNFRDRASGGRVVDDASRLVAEAFARHGRRVAGVSSST